jgi:hypothetical protein
MQQLLQRVAHIYIGLARTVFIYAIHDRMSEETSAKNTEYTPYM